MKPWVIVAGLAGLALATAIVGYFGFGAVFDALSAIGWRGLAFLCVYSAAPICLLGAAWFLLDETSGPRRLGAFIWARMLRDAGGELLPFLPVGGFVIGARAAILQGVSASVAFSTSIVDVTTELLAQLGFTGLGLGLLAITIGQQSTHRALIGAVLAGLALSSLGAWVFIELQRRGSDVVERLARRLAPDAAIDFSRTLRGLYSHPWRIWAAVGVHFAAWVASAAGIWLALRLSGVDIGFDRILAIESLVCAARSAAVFAPMGIGVQEATYAVVGPLFCLGPELSIAVSLLKRARDLIIGAPALIVWQAIEGRRLVHGVRAGTLTGFD
ncbi:MAG TPA: lysylphosphatidylglycerol synthase domain-containing protein [Caulobacteraceae bacterium]